MSDFLRSKFEGFKKDEIVLSDSTFIRLRDSIYKMSGIYYNESKKYLLEARVLKRIKNIGLEDFESYLQLISSLNGREELKNLFDAITINETYFFRAEFQIDALEKQIIPELVRTKNDKVIRIWSAACSSGEEPYTIALVIYDRLRHKFPSVKFEIMGSDLSNEILKAAEHGLYKEYAIKIIPKEYLIKYFRREGDLFKLDDEIRKMVTFRNINLYDSYVISQLDNFDVIFCANVLIYFDPESKEKVVSSLYSKLNDGGFLFIGSAESLHNVDQKFDLIHFTKAMAYRK